MVWFVISEVGHFFKILQKIGSDLVVSNQLHFVTLFAQMPLMSFLPRVQSSAWSSFWKIVTRAKNRSCLTWTFFFEAMKTQEINLQKHAKTYVFFPSRPPFQCSSSWISMDFLMVDVWICYTWPTDCWELWPPEQPWASGLPVGLCSAAPTKWVHKMKEVRVIQDDFIKNWYYMDAFNTCFVNSAFFQHEAWSDENHSQYTLIKHFSSFELKSSWSRKERALNRSWTLHVCIGCLVLYPKCLFLYCSALEEARSTPKFWWL